MTPCECLCAQFPKYCFLWDIPQTTDNNRSVTFLKLATSVCKASLTIKERLAPLRKIYFSKLRMVLNFYGLCQHWLTVCLFKFHTMQNIYFPFFLCSIGNELTLLITSLKALLQINDNTFQHNRAHILVTLPSNHEFSTCKPLATCGLPMCCIIWPTFFLVILWHPVWLLPILENTSCQCRWYM